MDSWILILFCKFIIIYLDAHIGLDLDSWSPFKLAPFWYFPIILWAHLYLLAQQDIHGSSFTFPAPALEFAISPRSFNFF